MSLGAGRRDRRVTFLRVTQVTTALGGRSETFAPIAPGGDAWAAVTFGTGAERRQASGQAGEQAATFRVLSTAVLRGVTIRDRIRFAGSDWGISSIAPVGGAAHEIEFTAVRVV